MKLELKRIIKMKYLSKLNLDSELKLANSTGVIYWFPLSEFVFKFDKEFLILTLSGICSHTLDPKQNTDSLPLKTL